MSAITDKIRSGWKQAAVAFGTSALLVATMTGCENDQENRKNNGVFSLNTTRIEFSGSPRSSGRKRDIEDYFATGVAVVVGVAGLAWLGLGALNERQGSYQPRQSLRDSPYMRAQAARKSEGTPPPTQG